MNPSIIRLKRIKENCTQGEIAVATKMSPATYGAVESGQRMVKREKAEKISKALGLDLKKAFRVTMDNKYEVLRNA